MKKLPIIIVLIVLLIVIFIFILLMNKYLIKKTIKESFQDKSYGTYYTYYRCKEKMLGKILKNILDNNNIIQSNEDWNIYIPCGYNNIEKELEDVNIDVSNINNKYIFGLNGCDTIVSKNEIWNSLIKCYGREQASRLMPESYILNDPNEMMLFRKNFNSSKNDIYILKKNIQRKEGLKMTRDFFEILDSQNDDYKVVQKYITDLYLVNERKVNLRIYLLIVIRDNMLYFYVSNIGKCIYTNKKYNHNDLDFETNITSYHLDMNVYKTNPRNFTELKENINNNNPEKGDLLFENIDLLMKDISKCLSRNLYQSKNLEGTISFQLFGGDVIFDNDFHPYLLELNKGPDMTPRDEIDEVLKKNVQTDMLKIIGILPNDGKENSFHLLYKSVILKK